MPSVCKNSDKGSVTEQEQCQAPYKACVSALDKKVRNLEKRKVKLDGYREKLNKGEKLDKDQKEAIAKYEGVLANLEFARELHKQIQSMSDEADKLAEKANKKQAKKDKLERQQQESDRLSDVLVLQTLMLSLGTDEVRADLLSGKYGGLALKEEILTQLDEFYQLISPSTDSGTSSFTAQLGSATEHIISYIDRLDKAVVGTTYQVLHDVVDSISQAGFFEAAVDTGVATVSTADHARPENVQQEPDVLATRAAHLTDSNLPHDEATSSEGSGEMINMPSTDHVVESTYETMSMSDVAHALHRTAEGTAATLPTMAWCPAPPAANIVHPAHEAVPAGIGNHSQFQRPLHDIVSSLQGSYNFLQDSEIDMDQSFECVGYNMPPQKHSYTFVNQQYAAQQGATVANNDRTQFVPAAAGGTAGVGTHHNGGCVTVQQESGFVVVGHDPTRVEMQYNYAGNEPTFKPPQSSNVGPLQTIQSKVGDPHQMKHLGGGDPQNSVIQTQSVPGQRDVAGGHQGYGMNAGQGRYGMGPSGHRGGSARGGASRTGHRS